LGRSHSRFGLWGKEKTLLPKKILLFWYVTQRRLVLCYRSLRTNCWYHLQGQAGQVFLFDINKCSIFMEPEFTLFVRACHWLSHASCIQSTF
jgi:hypothetical protein